MSLEDGSTPSATQKVLEGLETPIFATDFICSAIQKNGMDRLEFLASMSENGWERLLSAHHQETQVVAASNPSSPANPGTGASSTDPGTDATQSSTATASQRTLTNNNGTSVTQVQFVMIIACAKAASAEARRLLERGQRELDAATSSSSGPQVNIDKLIKNLTEKLGVVPPNIVPDEKVMKLLSKSSSAYVDFKLLNVSNSNSNARKRLRTTTTGLVVEVYEKPEDSRSGDNGLVLDIMGAWTAQFGRYVAGVCLVDEHAANNILTFLSYQCEIGRIALYSPARAVDADRQFRMSVPGIAATGVPVWQCYAQEHTAPFFSRLLAEMANRRMWSTYRQPKGGKGKGKGKGKGSGKGKGKGSGKGNQQSWSWSASGKDVDNKSFATGDQPKSMPSKK